MCVTVTNKYQFNIDIGEYKKIYEESYSFSKHEINSM